MLNPFVVMHNPSFIKIKTLSIAAVLLSLVAASPVAVVAQRKSGRPAVEIIKLDEREASHFAGLALKCVRKEYPHKLDHVIDDASQVQGPRALHPAFYGCYDWHSSVHGHWLLARLLKLYPQLAEAREIRNALNANLTAENIAAEVAYFKQKDRSSFERTYGWTWLLKLAEELRGRDDEDARRWSRALQPLVDLIVEKYEAFLPKQTYPIRTGVHPNTAFGLAFALDYARAASDQKLTGLIEERARTYYLNDANYPAAWEPGGEDFLSPALIEADLMRRVLKRGEFAVWFHKFLPHVARNEPAGLLRPATVTDRSDPKLVHLDGLNLSRAWCMKSIADALPASDPARKILFAASESHASDALSHVASGNYEGEHWLATFAVYLLSTPSQSEHELKR
ncbi:MAG: hypothetical protein QOE33_751 [Acidobacteriota bacterium]|nr:hypothetical protein [Acidobacteriota bacterium]